MFLEPALLLTPSRSLSDNMEHRALALLKDSENANLPLIPRSPTLFGYVNSVSLLPNSKLSLPPKCVPRPDLATRAEFGHDGGTSLHESCVKGSSSHSF